MNFAKKLTFFTLAVSLSFSLPCFSGSVQPTPSDLTEIPLEQLATMEVASASTLASQISDANSAVAIVTAKDIKTYGYHTLSDIFSSVRGLYVTNDHAWDYLGGRGFGRTGDFAGRILLLIDGYSTNDGIYNQIYSDNFGFLDTELIDRVEYIPGTGSVLYGNNAYFGVINVITKKGRAIDGTQVATELMSHGGKKGRITFGKKLENGADILASSSWLERDGQDYYFPEFDNPTADPKNAINHGIAHNLDYESSKRLFAKIHLDNLTVEGGFVDHKKGIPTAAYGVAFNAYKQNWDTNGFLSALYNAEISKTVKSSTHLYTGSYLDRGAGYYDATGMWKEHDLAQWWGLDEKLAINAFDNHQIIVGTEFRNDFIQHTRTPVSVSDHSRSIVSIYLQDEIQINDWLKLNLGARYDDANDSDSNISPRFAIITNPSKQTTLKLAYSRAFRLPAPYEKYYTDGEQVPNPSLGAERVSTTEIVLQHELSKEMHVLGTLYQYKTSDLITDVDIDTATNHFVNTGSSKTHGIEMEFEGRWNIGLHLKTSYAWQRANDSKGNHMINSPTQLAKLNIGYAFLDSALLAGYEMQYVGPRLTENGATLGGFTLANLTLSSDQIYKHFNISTSIKNIFDKHYRAVAQGGMTQDSFEMDGRNFWLQLGYDFK